MPAAVPPSAFCAELLCPPQQFAAVAALLQRERLAGVNLPNKSKGELPQLLERCRAARAAMPAVPLCCHYSICQNWVPRDPAASFQRLEGFAAELADIGGCSLLLVSGSTRKKLDSALELLAASPRLQGGALPLAVAFNPYFPDVARREEERGRLRRKLEAGQGRIATIYLQAGSGAAQLEDSLRWLGRLLDELAAGAAGQQGEQRGEQRGEQQGEQQAPPGGRPAKRRRRQAPAAVAPAGLPERLRVFGSLLVPSKKLLAQMKFRPWAGVFLSDEYLGSTYAADAATVSLLRVYLRHGVTPLVETAVETEAQLGSLRRLLGAARLEV